MALSVPYVGQVGPGADARHNDCGPACAAMLLRAYRLSDVSVDALYDECRPGGGDEFVSVGDLIRVLAVRELAMRRGYDAASWADLRFCLSSGRPVIALILYAPLVDVGLTFYKGFRGPHFVVVVDADDRGVKIHDPYWPSGNRGGEALFVPADIFDRAWTGASSRMFLAPLEPIAGFPVSPLRGKTLVALNVRDAPDPTGAVLFTLSSGVWVPVTEVAGGWAKISGLRRLAWCSANEKFLSVEPRPAPGPAPSPAPGPGIDLERRVARLEAWARTQGFNG